LTRNQIARNRICRQIEHHAKERDEIMYITDRPMANGDYVVYVVGKIGGNGI